MRDIKKKVSTDNIEAMEDFHGLFTIIQSTTRRCPSLKEIELPQFIRLYTWEKIPDLFFSRWRNFSNERQSTNHRLKPFIHTYNVTVYKFTKNINQHKINIECGPKMVLGIPKKSKMVLGNNSAVHGWILQTEVQLERRNTNRRYSDVNNPAAHF